MKKIYISIIATIVLLSAVLIGVKANKRYGFFQSKETSMRIYNQGLEDIKNNNLQNAYYNFSKISKYSDLYEAALFRQGLIATELNDNESAIQSYETLLYKFPNTFFAEKAIYNLSVAYYNNNMPEQAYANFKIIAKKYANSDYADAANYFLGVMSKQNDDKKAVEYFLNYIKIAPLGRYALSSVEELKKLKQNFSSEENLHIAIALSENGKYNDALYHFNMSKPEDSWAYLSMTYKKLGNTKASRKIFEEGLSKYSVNNSEIQEKAIDEYVNSNGINSLKNIKALCDKSKCQLNDYIMYKSLNSVDKKTKLAYYNTIYTDFPNGKYAADALFNSLFNDYLTGNYENAIIKAKKHISLYSDKKSAPATMYWLARIYGKKHNVQEENSYYNKIILKYADSYYAYLAFRRLNKEKDPYVIKDFSKIPEEKIDIEFPILHANLSINATKRIDLLIKTGDFKIFEYADFDNEIIKSWVGYYEGDMAKASVIAEKIINETEIKPTYADEIYKLVYPIAYAKEINKYSGEKEKIAPFLLLSLIRKESHFAPKVQSSAGATGLTQLMPDTAQFIAQNKNIAYNKKDLTNPDYNIMLGSIYYNYIKSQYFKQDVYTLAAYNSGYGNVSKWIKNSEAKDFDEFVETIPYNETKEYIKQIYKNYWAYICIYNPGKI